MRYAILFSGMSCRRHVNGLELCYRTLIDQLGFTAAAIFVLNYDGSLRALGDRQGESVTAWPGDGTAYRMVVDAEGNRKAFQQVVRALGARLEPDDQLFINVTGHGGHRGDEDGPDLLGYPHCERYERDEFCADLALLPQHRSLVLLMAQCFSGGFIQAVQAASPARQTYIATAAGERHRSFMDFDDGNWDSFQRNWIAAIAGRVSVHEAFQYATRSGIANPYDSPQFAATPPWAGNLTLAD